VIRVELEPGGQVQVPGPDGTFAFLELMPGPYQLTFIRESGPVTRLTTPVFAFRGSRVDVEIGLGQ
jgi:hypothetical protein